MVEDSEDNQIILTATGLSIESIDIESSEGTHTVIPSEYKHSSYHESNGCAWFSTCLLIRSQDSELDDYLLIKYKKNCEKYEWLCVRGKGARLHPNITISL